MRLFFERLHGLCCSLPLLFGLPNEAAQMIERFDDRIPFFVDIPDSLDDVNTIEVLLALLRGGLTLFCSLIARSEIGFASTTVPALVFPVGRFGIVQGGVEAYRAAPSSPFWIAGDVGAVVGIAFVGVGTVFTFLGIEVLLLFEDLRLRELSGGDALGFVLITALTLLARKLAERLPSR